MIKQKHIYRFRCKLTWKENYKSFELNIPYPGKFFIIRFQISKFKNSPVHLYLYIKNLLTLDTVHKGKKLYKRLYLTGFLGRDLHVYHPGESTYGSNCKKDF